MSEGYIVARVYTSRSMIPIKDASVAVLEEIDNRSMLIGYRKTDEVGKTTPISIQTPDREMSQSPNDTETFPFTQVNIQIEHPNYYTMYIRNVQVFADTTSVQNAELIPIEAQAEPKNAVETFEVLPQNL